MADGGPSAALWNAVDGFIVFISRVEGLSPETVRAYQQHLEAFASWAEDQVVDGLKISPRAMRRYVAHLRERGLAPRSVSAHLSAIRSLFRWCELEGIEVSAAAAAVQAPKIPRTLPKTLSSDQMGRLLSTPDLSRPEGLRDAAMLELFYATGARISELSGLDIESIDMREGTARLFGKGSKERIVPVYRRALDAVGAYLERGRPALMAAAGERDEPGRRRALLVSRRGRRMDAGALRYRFRALARRAGLPADITPHALRHTYATDLLSGGADLRSVQELLGHASLSTTQLYTHLTPERLKAAIRGAHPRA